MNAARRIAKNTLVLLIAQIFALGLGFIYTVSSARYLGVAGFGVISFALAFTGIFGILTDLGLGTLTTRDVARDKLLAGKYLGNVAAIISILVVITFGLIALTLKLFSYPEQTVTVVYFVALSVIFNAFTGVFNALFQAFEKMEYQSIGGILNSILMVVGIFVAIKFGFGVDRVASIYFVVSVVVLTYSFLVYWRKFSLSKVKIDWRFWRPLIKQALPFGLSAVFITIFYWIDSVILSLLQGNDAVGVYSAAYRLMIVLLFIPTVVNIAIFPAMSRFYITSKDALARASNTYFRYMAIVAFPIGVGTTLLADKIIYLIYGTAYVNSTIALQILVWSSVFIFLGSAFTRLLLSSNRQMIMTKITGILMIGNIALNLVVIPRYSYIGASFVTVITEFASLVLCVIVSSRLTYGVSNSNLRIIAKTIFSSLLMGLLIIQLGDLNLGAIVVISGAFYFVVLSLLRGFDKDDIALFRSILNRF